jgi:heme/copper-type cytochrome/quinol oxidase subunit 2
MLAVTNNFQLGNLEGPGITPSEDVGSQISDIISTIIGFLSVLAIIWFLVVIFTSAYAMITSAGDADKNAEAKTRLTRAAMGLAIILGAMIIINIISYISGIDFLNIGAYIDALTF